MCLCLAFSQIPCIAVSDINPGSLGVKNKGRALLARTSFTEIGRSIRPNHLADGASMLVVSACQSVAADHPGFDPKWPCALGLFALMLLVVGCWWFNQQCEDLQSHVPLVQTQACIRSMCCSPSAVDQDLQMFLLAQISLTLMLAYTRQQ